MPPERRDPAELDGLRPDAARKSPAAFTMEAMRAFLAEKGVARRYWPERLELMARLPRTASGKIPKFELRDMLRPADGPRPERREGER